MLRVFISVDVSVHVPYDLVGEQLRLLTRPQDVLPNVPHLVVTKGLDQLRDVEQHRLLESDNNGNLNFW